MELNTVVSEIKGKVGIITLNRPKALNAVSEEMLRELTSQTKAFDEDPWSGRLSSAAATKPSPPELTSET